MVFQVLGLWLHLKEILGLGLTVTEINIKKSTETRNKKDVGMACQKYAKKVDNSIKAKVNTKAMPHPYIFFTLQLDSMLET